MFEKTRFGERINKKDQQNRMTNFVAQQLVFLVSILNYLLFPISSFQIQNIVSLFTTNLYFLSIFLLKLHNHEKTQQMRGENVC